MTLFYWNLRRTPLEVEMWDGGLQEQEIIGYRENKGCFFSQRIQLDKPFRSGSISEQLKAMVYRQWNVPLKGYAGFRFVGRQKEGNSIWIIVTPQRDHCWTERLEPSACNRTRRYSGLKGDKNMGRFRQ